MSAVKTLLKWDPARALLQGVKCSKYDKTVQMGTGSGGMIRYKAENEILLSIVMTAVKTWLSGNLAWALLWGVKHSK